MAGVAMCATQAKSSNKQIKDISMTDTTVAPQPQVELSEKGFVPTLLLCFFLGAFGVHRFYVGKIGTGLLMLITLGGLGIWTLIDFIIIAVGSFKDKEGRLIKSQ